MKPEQENGKYNVIRKSIPEIFGEVYQ